MKEISNQWRTEKQHHIHGETYEHIKPEYGIVVIVGRLLDVDKGLRKATALQITSNESKDGKNADDSIIGWSKQSGQEYSEKDIQYLRGTTVHSSPKQSLGCLFLQCFCHFFFFIAKVAQIV